ncbi:MAG: hypothetical protein QOG43_1312 [Actinomycetota bacterium]|jgi:nitroimidazol reductase NimA-like FMN-containing flavoprotein (pyridoxamine 5'-phosphate oxidase superfamily)|nr:hypothetical protein [Actinomycetota bacterium]
MSRTETLSFLEERHHLVRLATVDADHRPHVVPVWYLPVDGSLLITPRAESSWLPHLDANPWVAAAVDEGDLPYRKVVVSTKAEMVYPPGHDDAWRDEYRRMSLRYWDEEAVDAYLESTIHIRRALIRVPVRLETPEVQTWRLPVADEDPRGIWALRYGPVIFGSGASSGSC